MRKPRALLLFFLFFASIAWIQSSGYRMLNKTPQVNETSSYEPDARFFSEIKLKATEASTFARQNKYNTELCFLINMRLPSSKNRFFVYNLAKDSIIQSGLVTHGRCNQYWLEGRKYGNTVGCGCSSLGKYKIGYSYNGRFGLAYKLYGLDKTNDKAFARFVILHGHSCVPDTEVEDEICQSDGCPTVAPNFLQYLKPLIDNSARPVLLWIYE